jgi:hypothetical protein
MAALSMAPRSVEGVVEPGLAALVVVVDSEAIDSCRRKGVVVPVMSVLAMAVVVLMAVLRKKVLDCSVRRRLKRRV